MNQKQLLKSYGLIPVPQDPVVIKSARRQLSDAGYAEAEEDRKRRYRDWADLKDKPVGL